MVAVTLCAVLMSGPAHASSRAVLVMGGYRIDQIEPIANASYLAWAQNSVAHPKHYDAFFRPIPSGRRSPKKMNASGTQGFLGGIDGDTDHAIYQQISKRRSNLFMYDLSTGARSKPPSGIDTKLWEWAPTISSSYIEFGRVKTSRRNGASRVLLYDRTSGKTIQLASEPRSCFCIWPYQVSDRFATWVVCLKLCRVWFYDISRGRTHRVPDPSRLDQYDPSIDGATGSIYFVQARGSYCGSHIEIMRWAIGTRISSASTVAGIPAGYDVAATTYVYVDASANDRLYFDRLRCSGNYFSDIYEVADAQSA